MCSNPKISPLRENVKLWNQTAKDCYAKKCICENCFIYHKFFKNNDDFCHMKYYVGYLLEKLGKPQII